MSHSYSFWRNSCSHKVHYPTQNWREADEVLDGTVGVGDPHSVELVSIDGCSCGMVSDITQRKS